MERPIAGGAFLYTRCAMRGRSIRHDRDGTCGPSLAFSDTFYLLGIALIVALMAALLLKKPDHLESGGAH